MDAKDLVAFHALAANGNIREAAKAVGITQTALKSRVRTLERDLGLKLIQSDGTTVMLTAMARYLTPYTDRVRLALTDIQDVIRSRSNPSGSLCLGAVETTLLTRLAPFLSSYTSQHPMVDLTIRTGMTRELIEAVRRGKLDGAFVAGPITNLDLETEAYFHDELVLITPRWIRHVADLGRSGAVKVAVLRSGGGYREKLEKWLIQRGMFNMRVLEFGTIDAVVTCVAAGISSTVLPRHFIERHDLRSKVTVHDALGVEKGSDVVFIRRRNAPPSDPLSSFLRLTRERNGIADGLDEAMRYGLDH